MKSDIILENEKVKIEGKATITGPDLEIDARDRRKSNGGYRRAVVHNFDDGLTLNWNKDYPGGVTIMGKTSFNDSGSNGVTLIPETYNSNNWPKIDQNQQNQPQLNLIKELKHILETIIQLKSEVHEISVKLGLKLHTLSPSQLDKLKTEKTSIKEMSIQKPVDIKKK